MKKFISIRCQSCLAFLTYFISIVLLILVFIPQSDAQILPKIRFKNLDKTNGLPNNNVNAIMRDNFGYMWFGTNDGLCRYETPDRMQVIRVNEDIKGGLKSSNIRSIHVDKKNNIWIGTRLGGLSKFNQTKDEWETFIHDPNNPTSLSNDEVLEILEDSQGRLWIGTENGLNLFHPETKSFSHFKIDENDPTALRSRAILTITEDDKGWIWVGTWAGGLHLLLPPADGNIVNSTFRNFNINQKVGFYNVWEVFQDEQKRYWVGTFGEGLYLMQIPENASNDLSNQDWEANFHNYKLGGSGAGSIIMITSIIQDSKDNLWVGGVHGLNMINAEDLPSREFLEVTDKKPELVFTPYVHSGSGKESLAHNFISSIYEDKQGIVWLSTYSGVSKYNWSNNQFDRYEFLENNFDLPNARNFYISPNQIAWLVTGERGILQYDFNSNEIKRLTKKDIKIINNDAVTVIYSPNDKDIYFGSSTEISHYNNETERSNNYPIPDSLKNNIITSLFEDKENRLWICTDSGLFLLDKKNGEFHALRHHPNDDSTISDNSIVNVLLDTHGDYWVTTFNGLNRLRPIDSNNFQITSFKHKPDSPTSIPSNKLTDLEQIGDILYIGTTNGLCGYDFNTESFINFSKSSNKLGIQSMEKTAAGNLWASTTDGIFYFDTKKRTFNIFEQADGLGDVTYSLGASQTDKEGFIYFGNRRGITRLHPEKMVVNTVPPPIYITQIKEINTDGKKVLNMTGKGELSIPHNNYYLSIDFSAVNYNSIEKNTYAYKLEGFEEDWNYTDKNMSAIYTNLEHGDYTFRVKAANNDGVWNEAGASLKITKVSAFWETSWFQILVLAAIGGLIWFAFFVYTKSIRHRNAILNKYNTGLSKEINERKRAEQSLQEREQFLRLIMDNIPQHVYWVDINHNILGCNTSFLGGFVYENEIEIIGKNSQELFELSKSKNKIELAEQKVLKSGKPILNQVIKVIDTQTKEEVWMDKNYIPLKDEAGKVFGVLVTGEDITTRINAKELLKNNSKKLEIQVLQRTQELGMKNKEIQSLLQKIEARNEELEVIVKQRTEKLNEYNMELQQSNNDLGQFAYIASHDMKEPLRIIGNFAGLLSRKYKGKLDKSADEYIYFIEDGIKRMSALMDSLLTYSQVGKKEIELSKTNLNNILFAKTHDLSEVIKERNVEMQIDDLPEIYCEKEQIGMVFFNLINNGIKFNKSEKPIIKVEVHDDAPEGFWKFSVTDNGIGILPEFQSQIFEIFRRLHSKQEYKGTGIGLALTQKIVLRHGGTIKVLSIPAEGTTFVFTIAKAIVKETDGIQETVIRMNKSQDRIEQKYAFNKENKN